jgi:hypothetical protein
VLPSWSAVWCPEGVKKAAADLGREAGEASDDHARGRWAGVALRAGRTGVSLGASQARVALRPFLIPRELRLVARAALVVVDDSQLALADVEQPVGVVAALDRAVGTLDRGHRDAARRYDERCGRDDRRGRWPDDAWCSHEMLPWLARDRVEPIVTRSQRSRDGVRPWDFPCGVRQPLIRPRLRARACTRPSARARTSSAPSAAALGPIGSAA